MSEIKLIRQECCCDELDCDCDEHVTDWVVIGKNPNSNSLSIVQTIYECTADEMLLELEDNMGLQSGQIVHVFDVSEAFKALKIERSFVDAT